MVTLWPDEELGALTPEEPELVEVPEDDPELVEVPEEDPDPEVDVDWIRLDGDAWMVDGVVACDVPDAAKTAVPPVSAMATPAIPAVILLTRRRAS
ncbi:MAG: hypothetical protein WB765_08870 [Acidimicrobiales bacterium]